MTTERKEITEETVKLIKIIPQIIAILSFAIGTALLLLYLIGNNKSYYSEIGAYYILIAILINSLLFLGIIITSYFYKEYQLEIIKKSFLLLINIPIAILYLIIIIYINNN